jgi:hypothetical protein
MTTNNTTDLAAALRAAADDMDRQNTRLRDGSRDYRVDELTGHDVRVIVLALLQGLDRDRTVATDPNTLSNRNIYRDAAAVKLEILRKLDKAAHAEAWSQQYRPYEWGLVRTV